MASEEERAKILAEYKASAQAERLGSGGDDAILGGSSLKEAMEKFQTLASSNGAAAITRADAFGAASAAGRYDDDSQEKRAKFLAELASVDHRDDDLLVHSLLGGTLASSNGAAATRAAFGAASAAGRYDEDGDDDVEDDDEADWAGGDSSEEEEGDSDEEEEGETTDDPVVLNGTIHLNDEGRVIYSGSWCVQSQLDAEQKDSLGASSSSSGRKRHPKFKLKSQDKCKSNSNPLFDVRRPTLAKLPTSAGGDSSNDAVVPTRRTMIFDGFFFEPLPEGSEASKESSNGDGKHHHHNHHGKKIKERDIEVFFTTAENDGKKSPEYKISGRGYNEYGPFVLDGTYVVPPLKASAPDGNGANDGNNASENKEEESKHHHHDIKATVKCNKTYGSGGTAKATKGASAAKGTKRSRRFNGAKDDDSFDEDFDEKADHGEVNELFEDAGLSIEDLRRKYYGGGGGEGEEEEEIDGGGGKVAAKKPKIMDDSDDDDECGF